MFFFHRVCRIKMTSVIVIKTSSSLITTIVYLLLDMNLSAKRITWSTL